MHMTGNAHQLDTRRSSINRQQALENGFQIDVLRDQFHRIDHNAGGNRLRNVQRINEIFSGKGTGPLEPFVL
ncbi:hypothetical protein D3C81_1326050 [compost metagenome]